MKITDRDIVNIMLDVPHGFKVKDKNFYLYPPSLGMVHICYSLINEIGINLSIISKNPIVEILRVLHQHKDLCYLYISYNTFKDKDEILDFSLVNDRAEYFKKELSLDDVCTLMLLIIETPVYTNITKHLGIAEDKAFMQRVQNAKKNENTYVFGGKSIYGALIAQACEKYHWSYDYAVWGISYLNLQLMLTDAVTSIYLTDEERKAAFLPSPSAKKINITSKNIEEIKARFS